MENIPIARPQDPTTSTIDHPSLISNTKLDTISHKSKPTKRRGTAALKALNSTLATQEDLEQAGDKPQTTGTVFAHTWFTSRLSLPYSQSQVTDSVDSSMQASSSKSKQLPTPPYGQSLDGNPESGRHQSEDHDIFVSVSTLKFVLFLTCYLVVVQGTPHMDLSHPGSRKRARPQPTSNPFGLIDSPLAASSPNPKAKKQMKTVPLRAISEDTRSAGAKRKNLSQIQTTAASITASPNPRALKQARVSHSPPVSPTRVTSSSQPPLRRSQLTPVHPTSKRVPNTEKPASKKRKGKAGTQRGRGRSLPPSRSSTHPIFDLTIPPSPGSDSDDPLLLVGTETWVPVPWKPMYLKTDEDHILKEEDEDLVGEKSIMSIHASDDEDEQEPNSILYPRDAPDIPNHPAGDQSGGPGWDEGSSRSSDDAGLADSSFAGHNLDIGEEPSMDFTIPLRLRSPPSRYKRSSAVSQRVPTPRPLEYDEPEEQAASPSHQKLPARFVSPSKQQQTQSSLDVERQEAHSPIPRQGPSSFVKQDTSVELQHATSLHLTKNQGDQDQDQSEEPVPVEDADDEEQLMEVERALTLEPEDRHGENGMEERSRHTTTEDEETTEDMLIETNSEAMVYEDHFEPLKEEEEEGNLSMDYSVDAISVHSEDASAVSMPGAEDSPIILKQAHMNEGDQTVDSAVAIDTDSEDSMDEEDPVVEISSKDPKMAARAAAILKMVLIYLTVSRVC